MKIAGIETHIEAPETRMVGERWIEHWKCSHCGHEEGVGHHWLKEKDLQAIRFHFAHCPKRHLEPSLLPAI